jgi:protein FAM50
MASDPAEERRRAQLDKKRAEDLAKLEAQKSDILAQTKVKIGSDRFTSQNDGVENALKAATVGLVRLEDFQRIKEGLEEKAAREKALGPDGGLRTGGSKKRKEREKGKVKLSFGEDEEEGADNDEAAPKSAKSTNGHEGNGSAKAEGDEAREGSVDVNGDNGVLLFGGFFGPDEAETNEEARQRSIPTAYSAPTYGIPGCRPSEDSFRVKEDGLVIFDGIS